METLSRRSSIVAMNVCSLVSHLIFVTTPLPLLRVRTDNPAGVFLLSGATALVTASASFAFLYDSLISASKLLFHQCVNVFDKIVNVLNRHLRARCDVVSAAASVELLRGYAHDFAQVKPALSHLI